MMSVLTALLLRRKFTLLAVVGSLMIATASTAIQPAQGTTPLTNPGFEDEVVDPIGDPIPGWTIGGSGAQSVETSFDCGEEGVDCTGITVSPVEGDHFALLTAGAEDVDTTVSQTFTAAAGETISGKAKFLSGEISPDDPDWDPQFDDHAQVVIKDAATDAVVATVFSAQSSTGSTLWEQWQHTFASAGDYYVEAGVRNVGDGSVDSYLALDAVILGDPPPEDTTPPVTTITDGPTEGSKVKSGTATFSFTASEDATFECSLDGAAFTGCQSPITYTDLSVASHTFEVQATDAADNVETPPASRTWEVLDYTPPVVTLSDVNGTTRTFPYSTNQNVTSVGGTCESAEGDVSVTLDGNATDPATVSCSSGSWTLVLSSVLSNESTYTFSASQTDAADNTGSSGDTSVTIDKTSPTIQSTTPLDGATKVPRAAPNITATFSERMGSFPANSFLLEKVQVRKGTVTVLGPPVSTSVQNPAFNQSNQNVVRLAPAAALDKASYYRVTITTAATDAVGNPLQSGRTWRFKTGGK